MNSITILMSLAAAQPGAAASTKPLTPNWEDLTGPDFIKAIKQADGVCILPFGSVEKFGPAGPLGTNLYMARMIAVDAAKQDYAVVYPAYYVAQTTDVSNFAGTINYSADLQRRMLEETVAEMGRNGCRKIIISNGHSGNMGLIQWFVSSTMASSRPYVVYATYPAPPRMSPPTPETQKLPAAMQPSKPDADGHGGEERISLLMAERPDLVHPERARDEPVVAEGSIRLPVPGGQGGVQLGVSRFIEAPTSYLGDASGASAVRGKALLDYAVGKLVAVIRAVKADKVSANAQAAFGKERDNPR